MDDVIERTKKVGRKMFIPSVTMSHEVADMLAWALIREALRAVSDTHRLVPVEFVWEDSAFDPICDLGDYDHDRCVAAWRQFIDGLPDYTEATDG